MIVEISTHIIAYSKIFKPSEYTLAKTKKFVFSSESDPAAEILLNPTKFGHPFWVSTETAKQEATRSLPIVMQHNPPNLAKKSGNHYIPILGYI